MTLRKYWQGQNLVAMSDEQKAITFGWYKITDLQNEDANPYLYVAGEPVVELNEITKTAIVIYPIVEKPLPQIKQEALQRIAASRWNKMVSGLTLPSGITVDTSEQSQARITGMVTAINSSSLEGNIKFKTSNGWVDLTQVEALAIGAAVGVFVQELYAQEFEKAQSIATALTAQDVIDIATETPANTVPIIV